jgi:hypothetical protein
MAGSSKKTVVVRLRPGSDADAMHRPVGSSFTEVNPPTIYLEKIATEWMKARGEAQPGVSYILERLPAGYALFQKPRFNNPNHFDKWLYGHPQHKPFDSPNRFYPHFEYLMNNDGNSIGCPCSMCVKNGVLHVSNSRSSSIKGTSSVAGPVKFSPPKARPSFAQFASQLHRAAPGPQHQKAVPVPNHHKGRPKMVPAGMDASRVDEEGTPDVYRNLIDKLHKHRTLDETSMEPMSMDWRAEKNMLPEVLRKLDEEAQWVPRVGDIVLYIRDLPEGLEILQDTETAQHKFFNPETEQFEGTPVWQAGLVGQTPTEAVDLEDAIHEGDKESNVTLSGIRVEPLPNPNDKNKSMSKRYRYVPVNHTRPFFLWQDCLDHNSEDDWHPTIKNALTSMSTVALMGKNRFRGEWPKAQIYCCGIYIGAEFLAVGDTIRLLPKSGEGECTDILVIRSIRLMLSGLDKATANDYDESQPYSSNVWIYGSAFTTESSRSDKLWLADENSETPRSAGSYQKWYPLHPVSKEIAVPFSRVLGRLYDHDAMRLWLPSSPNLDQGREAVIAARTYARENDSRIVDSDGATWFWADSRSEALDLQTVNGLELAKFDMERKPKEQRAQLKLLDGGSLQLQQQQQAPQNTKAADSKGLRSFMAPAKVATLPVRAQSLRRADSGEGFTSTRESSLAGHKRKTIELSDDEEEDEFLRNTRIIDDDDDDNLHNLPSASQGKKAKVMVRVD